MTEKTFRSSDPASTDPIPLFKFSLADFIFLLRSSVEHRQKFQILPQLSPRIPQDVGLTPKASNCCSTWHSPPQCLFAYWKEPPSTLFPPLPPTHAEWEKSSHDWHYVSMLSLLSTKPVGKQGMNDCLSRGGGDSYLAVQLVAQSSAIPLCTDTY